MLPEKPGGEKESKTETREINKDKSRSPSSGNRRNSSRQQSQSLTLTRRAKPASQGAATLSCAHCNLPHAGEDRVEEEEGGGGGLSSAHLGGLRRHLLQEAPLDSLLRTVQEPATAGTAPVRGSLVELTRRLAEPSHRLSFLSSDSNLLYDRTTPFAPVAFCV